MKESLKLWIAVATPFSLLFLFFYIFNNLNPREWYFFPSMVTVLFIFFFIWFYIISELFPEWLVDEDKKTIKRMEIGVQNQMDREKELLERIAHLEHHQATTIWLWATDKYDAIPKRIANLFFEIK